MQESKASVLLYVGSWFVCVEVLRVLWSGE
jgi:hypothetical protein